MIEGLGTKLRRLTAALDTEVQGVYDQLAVPFRPRFYPIVQMLLAAESRSVTEIAEATGVSQPAATQTINEMKRLLLVEACPGADRRARMIRLSARGKAVARELAPVWAATHRAGAGLDAELSANLHVTLDEALAALGRRSFGTRIRSHLEEKE